MNATYRFLSVFLIISLMFGCSALADQTGTAAGEAPAIQSNSPDGLFLALSEKEAILKTDEELVEMYNSLVYEEPDTNGKWHIPTSYRVRKYSAGVETEEIIDISDTVEKIRKRQAKWIRK